MSHKNIYNNHKGVRGNRGDQDTKEAKDHLALDLQYFSKVTKFYQLASQNVQRKFKFCGGRGIQCVIYINCHISLQITSLSII